MVLRSGKLKFSSVQELSNYLKNPALNSSIFSNELIRKRVATQMSKAVQEVVYNAYLPEQYVRRGKDGGLGDPENVRITEVKVIGNSVRIYINNITQGQDRFIPIYGRQVDSLDGQYIAETINDGIENDWILSGEWSKARPFIQKTIDNIRANPQPLINAIKTAYRQAGFSVR